MDAANQIIPFFGFALIACAVYFVKRGYFAYGNGLNPKKINRTEHPILFWFGITMALFLGVAMVVVPFGFGGFIRVN